jgi:hypothetical protein
MIRARTDDDLKVVLGSKARVRLYRTGLLCLALAGVMLVEPSARAFPGVRSIAHAVSLMVSATPVPILTPGPRDTFFDKPITFGNEPEVIPSPKASALPLAIPRRRRTQMTFGLSGSATTGAAVTSATRQSANGQATNALGLQASLERRSDRSDLRLSLPASVTTRGSYLGTATAEYVTSRGVFSFGYLPLAPLGSLPFTPIDRAYAFARPLGRGAQLEVFSGSGVFEGSRTFATSGMRVRRGTRAGVASLEAFHARATDNNGVADVLVGGFASRPTRISTSAELGFERLRGLGDVGDGTAFAYAGRADYHSRPADFSFTRRFVTDRFIGLGGAGGRPESLTQFGIRTAVGRTQIDAQTGYDVLFSTQVQGASADRKHGLTLARPIGALDAVLSFADDRNVNTTQTTWSGSGSQSLAFNVRGVSIAETIQATRATNSGSAPSSTVTSGLELLKPTTLALLQAQFSRTNQTGAGTAGRIDMATVGASRIEKRYIFGLSDTYTRTLQGKTNIATNATTLSLGRKLFGNVLLQVQVGRQSTRSVPSSPSNGSTTLVSFSLGAPFALGAGAPLGKPDPRAPATIVGSVVDEAVDGQLAGPLGGGVANLAVTLDGLETQHTDARGRFQFRFVTPGRHEVRIEPADLPRGFTVNYPYVTLTLAGGQTAQVGLAISGSSGAIAGRIAEQTTGGARGVENAAVRIDGTDIALTGPLGDFGFGRLKPGPHTLEVVDASLPAEVQIVDRKRSVIAIAGVTTRVDFLSAPLGSISGKLVAAGAGHDVPDGPIANAYVVANPGDRAAISNEDGTFTIDNLPAGTYSVAVDAETLPPDTDAVDGARTIELHPGERIEGLLIKIGEKLRGIDFTFSGGSKEQPLSLALASPSLPPGGATTVTARGTIDAQAMIVRAFGQTFVLKRVPKSDIYSGHLVVPLQTKAGSVTVSATTGGSHPQSATAQLTVDKSLPLVRLDLEPKRPAIGQYVRVRARFFAEVSPGDSIVWQDGTVTKIPIFAGPSVVSFTVRISAVPFHGVIRTKTLPVPITIGL